MGLSNIHGTSGIKLQALFEYFYEGSHTASLLINIKAKAGQEEQIYLQ
jgi:hypothetical protein